MSEQALSGYRVLDLADEAGVYGTKLLADLGAEVIKVEAPGGDRTRKMPPFYHGEMGIENSLYFAYTNTNKKSITLDLNTHKGQELFREIVKSVDVVYETFPPGHLDELGIGYKQLSKLYPKLTCVAITPFGQNGPYRDWKGSDLISWAVSGCLFTNGDPDRPPVVPAGPALLAYLWGATNAAVGVMLALRARRRTGRGQLVDISLQETGVAVTTELGLAGFLDDLAPRGRFGSRRLITRPFGLYPCKEGYAAIIIVQPKHWQALAEWIKEKTGIEEVTDPVYNDLFLRGRVADIIDGWTEALASQYTSQELFVEGQRRGISITPVNSLADIIKDQQLEFRGYWEEMEHPTLGRLRMAGAPYRMSETPWNAGRPPFLGEHNEAIYCGELGLSNSDLADLRASGVI